MTIAIIPARAGSKRIPHKNSKIFCGKPIILHTIEKAKQSGLFSDIIVSSDSQEICDIAKGAGAITPFERPEHLSDDFSTISEVLLHTLKNLKKQDMTSEYGCLLYATAPFIQIEYLKQAFDMIQNKKVSTVLSVTSFPFPPQRALSPGPEQHLKMLWPEFEMTRSNDLEDTCHDAGQFFFFNTDKFCQSARVYNHDTLPIYIPRYLVQDIDTEEDWKRAEVMYKVLLENGDIEV